MNLNDLETKSLIIKVHNNRRMRKKILSSRISCLDIVLYFLPVKRKGNCAKHCFTMKIMCVREYRMGNSLIILIPVAKVRQK